MHLGGVETNNNMNHTKSGAVAVGSEGSLARHMEELRNFEEHNYAWALLLATDEGRSILSRFAESTGAAGWIIEQDNVMGFLEENFTKFTSFSAGMKLAYDKL